MMPGSEHAALAEEVRRLTAENAELRARLAPKQAVGPFDVPEVPVCPKCCRKLEAWCGACLYESYLSTEKQLVEARQKNLASHRTRESSK